MGFPKTRSEARAQVNVSLSEVIHQTARIVIRDDEYAVLTSEQRHQVNAIRVLARSVSDSLNRVT